MGKLNLVIEDAPLRLIKNADLYQEIAEVFNSLPIGKAVTVSNEQLASSSLATRIRKVVTLKEGEDLRITRLTAEDGKITALRLAKVKKSKPAKSDVPAKSQGEAEGAE